MDKTIIQSNNEPVAFILVDSSVKNFSINGVHIKGVEDNSHNNSSGLRIGTDDNHASGTISIINCKFTDFTKNAVDINGGNVTITGNEITCKGYSGAAGNGIVIDYGATAVITDNKIRGYESNTEWSATGVLVLRGGKITEIKGNTISDCQIGICKETLYDDDDNSGTSLPENVAADNTIDNCGQNVDYEFDLAKAIENATAGDTIVLPSDITVDDTINIDKSITIDGNGFKILGNNSKAYSAFNITDGSFEIKNATLTDFGGNVYTKQETAVFYVAAGADSFTADTVTIKNFNRMGISVADGTYDIKNCTIECSNEYAQSNETLTKGIRIGYAENSKATGTISGTTITGAVVHPDWSASAIEVFYNGNATVDDCTIEGCDYGIWVDNYWYPTDPTGLTASVKVTGNTTITAKEPANEKNSAIIIYGKDGDKGGEITTDVVIESGTFNGQIKVADDNGSNDTNTITISGGKFENAGDQLKDFIAPGSNLKPDGNGGFTVSKKSSGGSHKFDNYITVITPKNGEVSVSDDWAYVGDKVTLTVTPDKGYVVDKIEIVDAEGNKLEAKKVEDKDNEYTFKVKNSDVTVTVTFKEEGKTTDDKDENKEDGKDDETTETTKLNFTDVNESDWFYKGVAYVVDKGIMSGVSENQFDPSGKLTRAMLVQMLYNMESRPACSAENVFIDVPVGQWYTDAVVWANDAKIVSGMGEGLFAPNMEITREQMVAMLYNYAKYKGYDVTASADLSTFADSANVSAWAQPAMQWAVAEGYISGMGGSLLAPQGTATRAEIASVIMRFMEATAESAESAE